MIETSAIKYKKAYVELSELLKRFPKEIFDKIPSKFIESMEEKKDSEYVWNYDESKSFEEQSLMVETKALFVKVYKDYLAGPEEKEKWEKYDKISKDYIEEEKAKLYDPSKIFEKEDVEVKTEPEKRVSNTQTASFATVIPTEPEKVKQNSDRQYLILMEEETTFQKIKKMFKEFVNKIFGKNK